MDIRSLTYNYFLKEHQKKFFSINWEDKIVLEIGCGLGFNSKHFKHYIGTDIAIPLPNYLIFPFVQANAIYLPFKENAIDHFICISMLEHFESPLSILRELYRVSRYGGIIAIPTLDAFPFIYDPINWIRKKLNKKPTNFGIGGFGHKYIVHCGKWEQMFKTTGFSISEKIAEDKMDFFAALEFFLLSIPFSSLEYCNFVQKINMSGESNYTAAKRIMDQLYNLIYGRNIKINGNIGFTYILNKV